MNRSLLIILALLLSSCFAYQPKPEVNLVDVQFLESTLFETNLQVKIRIINPRNNDLEITGSQHQITINDINLGRALSKNQILVPALGEATDLVTLRVSNLKLMTRLEKLISSKDFTYKIDSSFYTNQMLGLGTIRSSTEGTPFKSNQF